MHPAIAGVLFVAVALIFLLPKKYVIAPVLLATMLVPTGQVIVLAGVHLDPAKIIVIPGLIRAGFWTRKWNLIDRAFVAWAFCRAFSFILLWMEPAAITNKAGFLWEAFGLYFLLRSLIRNEEDVLRAIRVLVLIACINAIGMVNEQITNQNVFGLFGGLHSIPEFRAGKIRSSGAFQISILAGTFGVTIVPLFVAFWRHKKSRLAGLIGILAASVMVITCASSTPLSGYIAAILGLCFWHFRKRMRLVLWGLALTLLSLHIIMKAPVWFLIAHLDLTGASSGYHRAMIIDQCISHFWDWCLLGTKSTSEWGVDMWDKCDQFVFEAEEGGLGSLACFIALIVFSFKRLKSSRVAPKTGEAQRWVLWCLSVALFTHVISFLGADYFDQSETAWFLLLAMVSGATSGEMYPELSRRKSAQSELLSSELVDADVVPVSM